MNSLRHAELLAGHSAFDLGSIPNSHCSWRMTSWDGRGAGGCRENYEWTKAEKGRMKQRKSVEAERQSLLIRFLGRMTKLCGMQRRGEREVIKSSATKRGGKNRWQTRGTRLAEEPRTAEPSIYSFPLSWQTVWFLSCYRTTTNYTPTVMKLWGRHLSGSAKEFNKCGSEHRNQTLCVGEGSHLSNIWEPVL